MMQTSPLFSPLLHYTPRVRQPSFPVNDLRANNTDEKQKRNVCCVCTPEKPPISVKNFFFIVIERGKVRRTPLTLGSVGARVTTMATCCAPCQRPRTTSVIPLVFRTRRVLEYNKAMMLAYITKNLDKIYLLKIIYHNHCFFLCNCILCQSNLLPIFKFPYSSVYLVGG